MYIYNIRPNPNVVLVFVALCQLSSDKPVFFVKIKPLFLVKGTFRELLCHLFSVSFVLEVYPIIYKPLKCWRPNLTPKLNDEPNDKKSPNSSVAWVAAQTCTGETPSSQRMLNYY